ncbi:hypothetical protein OMCYN_00077 [cyanobiont of Ornithocercus magnificus]|nr:hypothetical protein OMCYN_00077 [cyanobiont of Ornithocercus magnificus]
MQCSLDWPGMTPSAPSLCKWVRKCLEEQGTVLRWGITGTSVLLTGAPDARRLHIEAVLLLSQAER